MKIIEPLIVFKEIHEFLIVFFKENISLKNN